MATIPMHLIEPGTRLRQATEETVAQLVDSIAVVGLLSPVTLYRRKVIHGGIAVDGFGIVAGLHRFEACKRLGLAEIEANVVDLDELHRQLAECDENLMRSLSPAERALFTARRKEIYEALHPETRASQNASRDRKTSENSAFVSETADRAGRSRRAVEIDAARGSALGDDLDAVKGTSLDKGVELDALAKLAEPERKELIQRAKAGEQVSARKPVPVKDEADTLNDFEATQKQVNALIAAWNRAGPEARDKFREYIDNPVFDSTRAA